MGRLKDSEPWNSNGLFGGHREGNISRLRDDGFNHVMIGEWEFKEIGMGQ
jgi:hypothetical protein